MCTTCGCSGAGNSEHNHGDKYAHEHHHGSHQHQLQHTGSHHQARIVEIERSILSKNAAYADRNRKTLEAAGVVAFNLVSSPGSGKTTLLVKTIERLKTADGQVAQNKVAVIEGDQQTALDADRIRESGVAAHQINTGKGCHLDAHQVGHALEHLGLDKLELVFIENVGNLVCPAAFDLGEQARVAVLSVTEGEDKPLKYPDMFQSADLMLINKIDLLPYVDFDMAKCIDYARRINPNIDVLQVSAKTDEGMGQWLQWLLELRRNPQQPADVHHEPAPGVEP